MGLDSSATMSFVCAQLYLVILMDVKCMQHYNNFIYLFVCQKCIWVEFRKGLRRSTRVASVLALIVVCHSLAKQLGLPNENPTSTADYIELVRCIVFLRV